MISFCCSSFFGGRKIAQLYKLEFDEVIVLWMIKKDAHGVI